MDPQAPNPSVEALLHAYLPHKFVDHTHATALLALADQPDAEAVCRRVFGDRVVLVPYVMPGFALAKAAARERRAIVEAARRAKAKAEKEQEKLQRKGGTRETVMRVDMGKLS
jgi:rhamnose utilization protein RhaD (predicted bifunctional aldolase and dehydrogenase)